MNYTSYIPDIAPRQESANPWVETNGCVSFSLVHLIEIWIRYLTGWNVDYSEQALYVYSSSTQRGNELVPVLNAAKKYGLIPTSVLPEPINFTYRQFNDPIVWVYKNHGKAFLRAWEIGNLTRCYDLDRGLLISPVWAVIDLGTIKHVVVFISPTTYFDSYGELIKTRKYPILSMYTLTLTRKHNMNVFKVRFADGKTLGVAIDGPNGTQIVKVAGTTPQDAEQQWRSFSKPDSYQLHTINADNTTDWTVDQVLPF